MKLTELKQLIKEEINKVLTEQENLTITKIEKGQGTGMAHGAIGTGYKITLSNGKTVQSDDDDLLGRYAQIRKGGVKTVEQLNKMLNGAKWDLDY
jgi:hypothetical protein